MLIDQSKQLCLMAGLGSIVYLKLAYNVLTMTVNCVLAYAEHERNHLTGISISYQLKDIYFTRCKQVILFNIKFPAFTGKGIDQISCSIIFGSESVKA